MRKLGAFKFWWRTSGKFCGYMAFQVFQFARLSGRKNLDLMLLETSGIIMVSGFPTKSRVFLVFLTERARYLQFDKFVVFHKCDYGLHD